jgi:hypothetical protein
VFVGVDDDGVLVVVAAGVTAADAFGVVLVVEELAAGESK